MLQLIEHFGSAEAAWRAGEEELRSLTWLGEGAGRLLDWRSKVRPAELWDNLTGSGVGVLLFSDPVYPQELKNIYNPPPVLYYRGSLDFLENLKVAVVGTRRATAYGLKVAQALARELAEQGVSVVSGLAVGIDAAAHRGALQGKGKTIAVLGCGVDVIYPRQNTSLFQQIAREGLILSELPPGTPPERHHFPARNRIISGLCPGTVVVEAGERSGALITADFALEQGRDVFAVPGPITSLQSKGTLNLIKQGAKLVTGVEDILEEYFSDYGPPALPERRERTGGFKLSPTEEKVLAALGDVPAAVEELVAAVGLPAREINVALTFLELQGLVTRMPGGLYSRC
ncbi:DNA-processing protein DprA [Thermanaeromonas sp. C210]|uniref:DNA-processing protein DprA n=1 Tax=Thermanaeromonas sp. C210 TaxID=2731925 RepID=UPI00155BA181|nr:DNA-processing protein DprA [Thermanaeromonas sp. C210]GFN23867.1 DNA processing protein DprA [Thermanaeromonas sp. C210]